MTKPAIAGDALEALVDEIGRGVVAARARDPFAPVVVATPSPLVGAYVELRLAETLGAAAAVELRSLRGLLRDAAAPEGRSPASDEELTLLLLAQLGAAAPDEPALAAYLDGDEARALDLAMELTREVGRAADLGREAVEAWTSRDTWDGRVVGALLDALAERRRYVHPLLPTLSGPPSRVPTYVVVPPHLSKGLADALGEIARRAPLTLVVPSPEGFVEDELPDDPAWVRLFGRAARVRSRRVSRLLGALSADDHGEGRLAKGALGRLQALVQGAPPPDDAPATLVALAAPTLAREVESVAARLARTLAEPGGPTAADVCVLLPSHDRASYEAKLREVFPAFGLPFSIVGERLAGASTLLPAASSLLSFVSRELTQESVTSYLGRAVVRGGVPSELMDRLFSRLAVRWGEDRQDLEGTYVSDDLLTFGHAFRRLALSLLVDEDDDGELPVVRVDGRDLLPVCLSPEEVEIAGALVAHLRRLFAARTSLRRRRAPLVDHVQAFRRLLEAELSAPDDEEDAMTAISLAVERLSRVRSDLAVPFPVAAAMIERALSSARVTRSAPLLSGVTVATLADAPYVPFRVVHALGLSARGFPPTQRRSAIDPEVPRPPGDPSFAEQQRGALFSRLLATRGAFSASWVARDPRADEPTRASPAVDDLDRVLRAGLGAPLEVQTLPELRSDDPDVLRGSQLARAEAEARLAAGAFAATSVPATLEARLDRVAETDLPRARATLGLVPPPPVDEAHTVRDVTPADLAAFLLQPVQAVARVALGLENDEDEGDPSEEALAASPLMRAVLVRSALGVGFPDARRVALAYDAAARRAELAGEIPTGVFKDVVAADHHARLDQLLPQITPREPFVTYVLGASRRRGERLVVLSPLVLSPRCRLVGATSPFAGTTAVQVQPASASNDRFLLPFVSVLALAASGHAPGPRVELRVPTGAKNEPLVAPMRVPPRETALAYLAALADELLSPASSCFFPFEAVLRWRSDPSTPLSAHLVKAADGQQPTYGPVRNLEDVPHPGPSEAESIVRRRFGLLFDCVELP